VEREGRAPQRIADGCTLHAGEPFTAICRQCGTYMCRRCAEDGQFDRCPDCRQQGAGALGPAPANAPAPTAAPGDFPFRRDGIEWGRFLRYCFEVYTKNFGLLTLTTVVCVGSLFAVFILSWGLFLALGGGASGDGLWWLVVPVLHSLTVGVLAFGVLKLSVEIVQNRPARLSLLWSSLPRLGSFLLISVAVAAIILLVQSLVLWLAMSGFQAVTVSELTLGTLVIAAALALVALVTTAYVSLGLVFAWIELVAHPELSVLTALKNGWRIAGGERLTIGFGLFLITLLILAGFMMCTIGVIFTLGFASVLFASLYVALRNGAPLHPR
jgi:hypothetical protein